MKTEKIWRRLNDALYAETCVQIRCDGIENTAYLGYVVGLSDEWVLFHYVNVYIARSDGYRALRVRDVTAVRADQSFIPRFLAVNGDGPVPQPDVLLLDLPGLLSSVSALFPLVRVHREKTHPQRAVIGRVVRIGKRSLHLRCLQMSATWDAEPFRLPLDDITLVAFGNGYNAALWRMAQEETTPSP